MVIRIFETYSSVKVSVYFYRVLTEFFFVYSSILVIVISYKIFLNTYSKYMCVYV